jgi:hypothetical protein
MKEQIASCKSRLRSLDTKEQIAKLGHEPEKPELDKLVDKLARRKPTLAQQRKRIEEFDSRKQEWDNWRAIRTRLDDLGRLCVTARSPEERATASSVEALKELQLPADLEIVTIETGDAPLGYHANVTFDLRRPRLSSFAVEGRDGQIVNGVFSTLSQELGKHQTPHVFAHKDRYTAVVALGLSVLIAWALLRIAVITKLWQIPADLIGAFAAYSFVLFILLAGPTSRLPRWLLPFFTYSEDRQNGRRRTVKGAISLVLGSLIVSLLVDAIRLLMLS